MRFPSRRISMTAIIFAAALAVLASFAVVTAIGTALIERAHPPHGRFVEVEAEGCMSSSLAAPIGRRSSCPRRQRQSWRPSSRARRPFGVALPRHSDRPAGPRLERSPRWPRRCLARAAGRARPSGARGTGHPIAHRVWPFLVGSALRPPMCWPIRAKSRGSCCSRRHASVGGRR